MKLRACAVLLAALGLSAPVFAQSSTAGTAGTSTSPSGQNIGASGVNETTGTSNPKNVKATGSGSGGADVGANRGATGSAATSGSASGTSGQQNIGASGDLGFVSRTTTIPTRVAEHQALNDSRSTP